MNLQILKPEDLYKADYLELEPFKYFEDQFIPIKGRYHGESFHLVEKDVLFSEGPNGYKYDILKGDQIYLEVESIANGRPESATSYTLKAYNPETGRYKYYPLLNLITSSCEGGDVSESSHYDIIPQIKNLQAIILGQHETQVEYRKRTIQVIAETIPDKDFWVGKPYHARSGYDVQKVLVRDGKYLRLRSDHWITVKEMVEAGAESYKDSTKQDMYDLNVWGEYNSKQDLAWHIYHNACLIMKTKGEGSYKQWEKQFDYYRAESIRRYKVQCAN
jgi:hypothetical protein